jgi:hypothetical protein
MTFIHPGAGLGHRPSRAIDYPTPEQIAQQHAELLQMLRDLSWRQANGRSVGGRYNKHDTARLRFIKDITLRGLWGLYVFPAEDTLISRKTF